MLVEDRAYFGQNDSVGRQFEQVPLTFRGHPRTNLRKGSSGYSARPLKGRVERPGGEVLVEELGVVRRNDGMLDGHGDAVGQAETISELARYKLALNVNVLAVGSAVASFGDPQHIE